MFYFFNIRKAALFATFFFIHIVAFAQTISICSWNVKDFGQSKTTDQLQFIARTIKDFDIVAIQEVVAGVGGPKAVIRLHEELKKTGQEWQYSISHGTSGDRYSKERYVFFWKSKKLQMIGPAWLEKKYNLEINREPYLARFNIGKKTFMIGSFHAIPKSKQPETEISYLKFLPKLYPQDQLILCGDFNLSQSHSVFNPLKKMGYEASMIDQKTSLRQKCINGDCLASEYDNFFYPVKGINCQSSGIIPFFQQFSDFKAAKLVSDHVPVFFKFSVN